MTSHSNNDFKDKINYLKVSVDIRYLLESLGFKITNTTNKEFRAVCRIHGGDNTTAFRFNRETRTWVCFTHKCHEIFGNDILGLIQSVRGTSFIDSVTYLESLVGTIENYADKWQEYKRKQEVEEFITDFTDVKYKPSYVSKEALREFKPFRSSRFLKDGYDTGTLDYFEVAGGYTDKEGYIRDIIPIYDDTGELVAYSMRDIRDDVSDSDKKYKITPGFDKDLVLYNLYNIKDVLKYKPVIIVEGFKSVWRLYEYGVKNVVAVMGSSITSGQINLLYTYAHKGCITMFDNDIAGVKGTIKAVKELNNKFNLVAPIFITEVDKEGKGLDPSDLSKEQVYNYLQGLL